MDNNREVIKAIVHYQQCLEKYTRRDNESRMLYCINKLYKMPITVEHLEQTGVGRTVNSLRKLSGDVGDAAKSLVTKWKEMVVGEDDPKDSPSKPLDTKMHKDREESKDRKHKAKSSSSSHKESEKKGNHGSKERNGSSVKEEPPVPVKKEKVKHHEDSHTREKESNSSKHKSSKRRQSSDESESGSSSECDKARSSNHKHKRSRYKTEDDSSDEESRRKSEKDRRSSHKHQLSKRKRELSEDDYEDDDSNSALEQEHEVLNINIKQEKLSDESEKSEDEIEVKLEPTDSYKHHSRHKNELLTEIKQEKSPRSHKHKVKKGKRELEVEDKPKKHVGEHRSKDKHSSTKEKAKTGSEKKTKDESEKKSRHSSSKHHSKEQKSKPSKSSSSSHDGSKSKAPKIGENGIGSGSGTSFADALGMLMPGSSKANKKKVGGVHHFPVDKAIHPISSPDMFKEDEVPNLLTEKKLEPLDINISNLLPEITPNYRPVKNLVFESGQAKNKLTAEDEALSAIMYNKILRTKVYSGNKVIWGEVPSLFNLCTRVLQDNIDALEYTGGVPYSILKPVVERASPNQLFIMEHHNAYLMEDTDELWELHCQKEFRNKKRDEMETWRDMYLRCLDEREAKLKALTANIKQSQDKSLPVRQTKLAYVESHSVVKPPRGIARKQAKHGTAVGVEKRPLVTPSSRLSTLATAGAAGQIAVPNPGSRAATATGTSSSVIKPKKAPLMQKTLAFMKNRLFRR